VNEAAKKRIVTHARPTVGLDNRLAGPADDFRSACNACHMTAQYPSIGTLVVKQAAGANPAETDIGNSERSHFFRNMFCGDVFDQNMNLYQPQTPQDVYALDYSLQLQGGVNNCSLWRQAAFPNVALQQVLALHVPGVQLVPPNKSAAMTLRGDILSVTLLADRKMLIVSQKNVTS